MANHQPISAMNLGSVTDLGALDTTPPPVHWNDTFACPPPQPIAYKTPERHTADYMQSAPGWSI